jgi:hypothetical protein
MQYSTRGSVREGRTAAGSSLDSGVKRIKVESWGQRRVLIPRRRGTVRDGESGEGSRVLSTKLPTTRRVLLPKGSNEARFLLRKQACMCKSDVSLIIEDPCIADSTRMRSSTIHAPQDGSQRMWRWLQGPLACASGSVHRPSMVRLRSLGRCARHFLACLLAGFLASSPSSCVARLCLPCKRPKFSSFLDASSGVRTPSVLQRTEPGALRSTKGSRCKIGRTR